MAAGNGRSSAEGEACRRPGGRAKAADRMPSPTDFLSCDWGTTSFRLRWVRGDDRAVLREVRNGEGVKTLHGRCVETGRAADPESRAATYREVVERAIRELGHGAGDPVPDGTPLMISGMASSTLGWRELPYARTPCGLDGTGLHVEAMGPVTVDGRAFPAWMVSGLSTGADVLRGEETELLGTLALPELEPLREGCLVVVPGTHSKHVRIRHGAIVDFRTHMTGELLELVSTQSVLRASVVWPPPTAGIDPGDAGGMTALRDGAVAARERGLGRGLFQVRVRSVLGGQSAAENAWYLVGLATGAEVVDLLGWDDGLPLVLAGSAAVSASYRAVFEALGAADRLTVVDPERLRQATIRAHEVLLRRGRKRT